MARRPRADSLGGTIDELKRGLQAALAERDEAQAQQAAIAMENARLITEQREALEQQTATAEILRVISQSPTDVAPVLEAVANAALRFCGAVDAVVHLREGDMVRVSAHAGSIGAPLGELRPLERDSSMGRSIIDAETCHISDMEALDPVEWATARKFTAMHGHKATVAAPMLRDGVAIGSVMLRKMEAGPFTPRQIALLETFAAQAVIAIENVRLFTELSESLEQQTATGEVLKVISQSPTDVQPVLQAVVAAARRFCGAEDAVITLRDDSEMVIAAHTGGVSSLPVGHRDPLDHTSGRGRSILDAATIHLPDVLALDATEFAIAHEQARLLNYHAHLSAPMLRDGRAIGCLTLRRPEAGPFTPRQIALLESFAAQAVIAIENVRLFTELSESLEQQTATAEVLRVISQSPTDVAPVLQAVVAAARRFCGAEDAAITLREGSEMVLGASQGRISSESIGARRALDRSSVRGRSIVDAATVHFPDVLALDSSEYGVAQQLARQLDFRAILSAPMLRDDGAIGCITLRKPDPVAFTPHQVELLETFAAQAVIAIENVRLFTELRESLEQQTATAEVLQVISQSPTDVEPVLKAVVAAARRFCDAEHADIFLREADEIVAGPHSGPISSQALGHRDPLDLSSNRGRTILEGRVTHIPDMLALDPDQYPLAQANAKRHKFRATVNAPMLRDGRAVGCLTLRRPEPGPFTPRQIQLLETFAAQAVIAIENVRLFTELSESLEQQTATAEILRVISQSPTDVQPVLDVVVNAARRFCGASDAVIGLRDGAELVVAAHEGPVGERPGTRRTLDRGTTQGRTIIDGCTVHNADFATLDPAEWGTALELSREFGFQAALGAPMLRDGVAIGTVTLRKPEAGPFTPRQIELLEAFAAQAVIAIENVRLFTELRESLDQQTATAEVLKVISQSPTDVQPVLNAVVTAARSFCGGEDADIFLRDGEEIVAGAHEGPIASQVVGHRDPLDLGTSRGRSIIEARTIQIPDVLALDPRQYPLAQAYARQDNFRAVLAVPMLREAEAIGCITLRKPEPGAFTPRQIQLLETFAAQAVIAIENVRLFTELGARNDELRESLDQQTATADILRVISQSPTDVQPVLDVVVDAARRFGGSEDATIILRDGDEIVVGAHEGPIETARGRRAPLDRHSGMGRTIIEGRTFHFPDVAEIDSAEFPMVLEYAREMGFTALLTAPMMSEGAAVGAVLLRREHAGAFTLRQIELLETFAAQAVIAIQNVRLFTELRESLEQQTATSEILETINRSQGDLEPVFDAIVAKAMTLCDAAFGMFNTFDGQHFHTVSTRGVPEAYARYRLSNPPDYGPETAPGRLVAGEDCVHVADMADSEVYRRGDPNRRSIVELGGARTILNVALRKEGTLLGMIVIYRQEVRPFSDKHITLLQGFAAQAVIAMENARLMAETSEALEQQTATAELLQIINGSPGDLAPVFDAILEKAHSLCDAPCGSLQLYDGEMFRAVADRGLPQELASLLRQGHVPRQFNQASREVAQVADVVEVYRSSPDDPVMRAIVEVARFRTLLFVPLVREGAYLGRIVAARRDVRPFTDKQVALLKNFAAQAVIAMENARLLGELRQRTGDLQESLDYQTATSEVLEVISRSTSDLQPVLDTMLASAARLCGVQMGAVAVPRGDALTYLSTIGVTPEFDKVLRERPHLLDRTTAAGRAAVDKRIVHIVDAQADPDYAMPETTAVGNQRTLLGVPLLREGEAVGVIVLGRTNIEPFTDRQMTLVRTFADQVVIAMENARLLSELRHRTDDLQESLEYQTATSEVLEVIGRSTSDIQPVLDTMLKAALHLCRTHSGGVAIQQGAGFRYVATLGWDPDTDRAVRARQIVPGRGMIGDRALLERRVIEIPDLAVDPEYPLPQMIARGNWHTALGVPLLRDGEPIGVITLTRNEIEPFTERQIALIKTFADQAVIAMENARLLNELRERTDDLTESLEYQTATSEVLEVISRSASDVQPVLDTLLASAARLCAADLCAMIIRRDGRFRYQAFFGDMPELQEAMAAREVVPGRGSIAGRTLLEAQVIHVPDLQADPEYALPEVLKSQIRTALGVPLMRDGEPIGVINLTRSRVEPFSERQIELVRTFADQAVIAMENARLLGELRQRTGDLQQSLEYQTATSDVLEVISRSTSDLQPVLDTMLAAAVRLCGVHSGSFAMRQGDVYRQVATTGYSDEFDKILREREFVPGRRSVVERVLLDKAVCHVSDITADPDYSFTEVKALNQARTVLGVPLMSESDLLGVLTVTRNHVEPFAERQIALLKTFADQAVIAMENARLLGELRNRTDDLTESLEYQTATSELLEVISRSTSDIQPVLDTLLASAARLCGAGISGVVIRRGDGFRYRALIGGATPELDAALRAREIIAGRASVAGRALLEAETVHVADLHADPDYALPEVLKECRTALGVPLMREGKPIGVITVTRDRVEPFTERQIALVKTFADQAVIAMENARLLGELTRREEELRVTFDHMGDGVVMFDADLRIAAWNRNFQQLLDVPDAFLADRPGFDDYVRLLVGRGELGKGEVEVEIERYRARATQYWSSERARPDGKVIEVRHNPIPGGGVVLIYSDITERKKAEAEIAAARDAAEAALDKLKAAQANLVQSEKMASLGQLTAGIAHEIKNPLNFVNNFASLSVELLDELKEVAGPALATLDEDKRAELDETMSLLIGNLGKITEHGKRADGIVKSMLSHSRGGAGDWQPADINALVEEALNLAYHGARAQDKNFNVTLERDFARETRPIDVVPQDVTRVFLNLFGNGFYAANKRRLGAKDAGFRPTIKVATRDLGEMVEVKVRDNGTGIPEDVRAKLFQPFFTTKPTGEGTGLGLSISYDIVTQQHGGTIEVESEVGSFTEFTVRLPRSRRAQASERAR
jgi:GAF domain-containing protein/nitrogen-specific signal transduction histidine kinase